MFRHWCTGITLVLLCTTASAQGDVVRAERKNLVGAEIGGRGLFFTFQYERFFEPKLGGGFGFFGAGGSDGWFGILPVFLSFAPLDVHTPYLSVGQTFILGDLDDDDFDQNLFFGSAGYQFHSPGGIYVRATFTLFNVEDGALLWPGVTIGGSF
jgi:hypothetical protein